MKITFIMTNASKSGGTRVIATHALELMRRGHEVTVVSTPLRRMGIRRTVSSLVKGKGWPKKWKLGASFFDGTGVPHRILEKFRAVQDGDVPDGDIIVATWWETAPWVAKLSARKGAKCFFIQHFETWGGGADAVERAWRLPLHKIVISRWLADLAREKFADGDVSLVPNSVDMNLFHAPPRGKQARPTVGLLYSAIAFKGVDVSLRALQIVRKERPDLRLVVFGDKQPVDSLPLPDYAEFAHQPAQEKIRELYAQCDVWLCGSRGEGFHLPPLEAMACGCPVVSTRVGGPLDTVSEGENGFLVDVEDASGLAAGVLRVLSLSDATWRKMSEAALETASRYTWQDAALLLEKAFETAIMKGRPVVERSRA